MITAAKARELSTANDVYLNGILEQIGKRIEAAANAAQTYVIPNDGHVIKELELVGGTQFREPTLTANQTVLSEKLKALGYSCKIISRDQHDYQAEYDADARIKTYHFSINW